jgi:hypothetical protein
MTRNQLLALAAIALSSHIPSGWRARYDNLEKVFAAKDMPALERLCAKELVWIQVDGTKKNRAETLAEFAEMFKAEKVVVREKLLKVKARGGLVDVSCEVFGRFSVAGKSDARMHSFCVDSWKKYGSQWKLVKTVDSKLEMTGGE